MIQKHINSILVTLLDLLNFEDANCIECLGVNFVVKTVTTKKYLVHVYVRCCFLISLYYFAYIILVGFNLLFFFCFNQNPSGLVVIVFKIYSLV